MGISTKGRKNLRSGAKFVKNQKKRKNCMGRQPANTKVGEERIRDVRVRGGNIKKRALRLNSGEFKLISENTSANTKIQSVLYHPSCNELMRTNTLTMSSVVKIDSTPFVETIKNSKDCCNDTKFMDILNESKSLYGIITSRPGQCGRADGYILQGDELKFYLTKIKQKKK